jgi:uncharacterized flavoprotein (TIGR03862 family)
MCASNRTIAVIGGGPAGLRAAEVAVNLGASVTLYDHKPSVGRKFLVAGKSGLNLTNAANFEDFCAQYSGTGFPADRWRGYLDNFSSEALREWALDLDETTFVASGGKVFPESKKAAPLLRRWVLRLKSAGVRFEVNHCWVDLRLGNSGTEVTFDHRGAKQKSTYDAVVLALGGASWPQTGSDGGWWSLLQKHGIELQPLKSANCGWQYDWKPETLAVAEGQPLHNLKVSAGDRSMSGELMVTRYGFEGSPIYHLGPELRSMESPTLKIDFKPMFTEAHMIAKMESARRDFYQEAKQRWKLSEAACAILKQIYGEFDNAPDLAKVAKHCRISLAEPRPIEEAISSAGGVAWAALDESLMLKQLPGVYCAGEMIDWEAPTGGFLIQGCFATGTVAGEAAAEI